MNSFPFRSVLIALAVSVAGHLLSSASMAADRVALVIGNGHYKSLPKLEACTRDAQKMAAAFQKIGIRVQGSKPLLDLDVDQMDTALNDFVRTVGPGSEVFIYYSGHGAQIGGSNFLLPVNFDAKYESQARRQAISLDAILELLEKTNSKLQVVILDACRDAGEFLPGEPAFKGLGHSEGMAEQKVDAPETLVCFATKHGTAALAGERGSPYTDVLAEEIVKPGEIDTVMRTVARRVYEATDKKQLPFTYGSLLQDHFFAGPAVAAGPSMEIAKLTLPATPHVAPAPVTPSPAPASSEAAAQDAPFVNSLGMTFVPAGTPGVLFSVWDTRVKDFAEFIQESGYDMSKGEAAFTLESDGQGKGVWRKAGGSWRDPHFPTSVAQTAEDPVVCVSWEDAQAFCAWLSKKEGRTYRLPKDHEWSVAVGIGDRENANVTPESNSSKIEGIYPWGTKWPPPDGAGNFAGEESKMGAASGKGWYNDGFARTSPVGSFAQNRYGLYDMGGNVWQWCEDWYNSNHEVRVLRGGSWVNFDEFALRSSCRGLGRPGIRLDNDGFRVVLVVSGR